MAHSQFTEDRPVLARIGSLLAGTTLALTLAFFGVLAFATGEAAGVGERVPFYVLGAAVTFASALIVLDRRSRDGRDLLVVSIVLALVTFCLVALGVEGLAYAFTRPGEALASNQPLYLLSAALFSTGLGYWGANHWREFRPSISR